MFAPPPTLNGMPREFCTDYIFESPLMCFQHLKALSHNHRQVLTHRTEQGPADRCLLLPCNNMHMLSIKVRNVGSEFGISSHKYRPPFSSSSCCSVPHDAPPASTYPPRGPRGAPIRRSRGPTGAARCAGPDGSWPLSVDPLAAWSGLPNLCLCYELAL